MTNGRNLGPYIREEISEGKIKPFCFLTLSVIMVQNNHHNTELTDYVLCTSEVNDSNVLGNRKEDLPISQGPSTP